jgi:4-diphosphocytidyl-2-C-methyl-D-erythritol kinase
MHLLAPAKLNLDLRVGRRDASGYHPLASWFCTVGLFDSLTIRRIDSPGARLSCDDPSLPTGETNLVVRAADVLLSRYAQGAGLDIELRKRIPAGGGVGGGSSDAARTLLGVTKLLALDLPLRQLHAIAAELGSDVPFFLYGGSRFCTGRGEVVSEAPSPLPRWALLIFPGLALPTRDVYQKFDAMGLGRTNLDAQPPWARWTELSARPLLAQLVNDLEPAAFALSPGLGELRGALESTVERVVRMTGSGSTLFTLFDEPDDAEAAWQSVQARHSLEAYVARIAPDLHDDLGA